MPGDTFKPSTPSRPPPRLSPNPDAPGAETQADAMWIWLDEFKHVSDEAQLRAHLKNATPVPPATNLVMHWQTKAEIGEMRGQLTVMQSTIGTILTEVQQRGKLMAHLAGVCKLAVRSLGKVTDSLVADVWVKRMFAAALIIATLGYSGFTVFSGSYGDAEVDFSSKQPAPTVGRP